MKEKKIDDKVEGGYWDFKEKYHVNKADMLHDILCLANNLEHRDAYLIFGVSDDGGIKGIEKDEKRKTQEQFTSFLNDKNFAGGNRPLVLLRTFALNSHEIDVLIIRSTNLLPYYLEKDFVDGKRRVRTGNIYTRVIDRNTPQDQTASPLHAELLWKIRFGLVPAPIERMSSMLLQKSNWKENRYGKYFREAPEFTIVEKREDEEYADRRKAEFYAYHQMNSKHSYSHYQCKYFDTVLFETQTVTLDSGRYLTPVPVWSFISYGDYGEGNLAYKYFEQDSFEYKLNEFFFDETNHEGRIARENLFEIVPIFYSQKERVLFESYVVEKISDILNEIEDESKENLVFDAENERIRKIENYRIHTGIKLVSLLEGYRNGN